MSATRFINRIICGKKSQLLQARSFSHMALALALCRQFPFQSSSASPPRTCIGERRRRAPIILSAALLNQKATGYVRDQPKHSEARSNSADSRCPISSRCFDFRARERRQFRLAKNGHWADIGEATQLTPMYGPAVSFDDCCCGLALI